MHQRTHGHGKRDPGEEQRVLAFVKAITLFLYYLTL